MHKFKYLLILLGTLTMALTLTACDGDKTTTKAENATTSENSTTGGNGTSTGGENGTTNSTTTPSTTEPTTPPATAPFSITIKEGKDYYGNKFFEAMQLAIVSDTNKILEKKQYAENMVFNNLEAGKSYKVCSINPTDFNKCISYYQMPNAVVNAENAQLFNNNATITYIGSKEERIKIKINTTKSISKEDITRGSVIGYPIGEGLAVDFTNNILIFDNTCVATKPLKVKLLLKLGKYYTYDGTSLKEVIVDTQNPLKDLPEFILKNYELEINY